MVIFLYIYIYIYFVVVVADSDGSIYLLLKKFNAIFDFLVLQHILNYGY